MYFKSQQKLSETEAKSSPNSSTNNNRNDRGGSEKESEFSHGSGNLISNSDRLTQILQ
jgi:hypothetical protein